MAVYDFDVSDDWVSFNVCQAGFWEENDLSEFGAPGNMLDIGGNVGYHTFAFAQAGWNVTTFEPMAPNLALIDATMCRNPKLAAKIQLNKHGLGTVSQECKMMAPVHNVGDGHVKCGNETLNPSVEFKEIGNFSVRRLDEVLREQNASKVDLVKIDVEGYEGQVFEGAPNFLAQFQPRLIKTEVWDKMVNSTGSEYLMKFEKAGYKFFSDTKCEIPMDAKAVVQHGGSDVIMCK
jgi:FkbM family methyltransferase